MDGVGEPLGMPGQARVQVDEPESESGGQLAQRRRDVRGHGARLDVIHPRAIDRTRSADDHLGCIREALVTRHEFFVLGDEVGPYRQL